MAQTAEQGPLITFGQGSSLDFNPDVGPNVWYQGDMLADPRQPYSYQPGEPSNILQTWGWYTSTSIPVVDQVPSALSTTNIVNAQAPTTNVPLTLVSASGGGITIGCAITNAATGAAVSGLLGIDVNSATNPLNPISFGQGGTGSGGPITCWNPQFAVARCLIITTNGNDSSGFYTVNGFDVYGFPMSQKLTGPNNTTATTTKAFKFISSVVPSGTIASTTVSVGTTDIYGVPLRTDRTPYINIWWGTPQGQLDGGAIGGETTMEIPIQVTTGSLANGQQFALDVPFDGNLVSINYRVTTATTGAGATVTLTAQANGASVTGGVVTPTLANSGTVGAKVAGSAITAGNTFTAGQTVGFVVSAFTGATTGAGIVELVVQNTDETGGTFVAAVTTNPATQTTGDVRGTISMPSASDGTKRLTIFWTPVPANMTTTAGLVGVTQV